MLSDGRNEENNSGHNSSAETRVIIVEVKAPASTQTIRTTVMKKLAHPHTTTKKNHQVMQAVVVAVTQREKSIRIGKEGCKLHLNCHSHSSRVPQPIQKILLSTLMSTL